jgi:DNA-binding response OmpR family regulator
MADTKPTVLVVEDSTVLRKLLAVELAQDPGLHVEQAANGADGLKIASSPECAVVILDMMLPDMDGLQFIEQLRTARNDPPSIIAMTGASEAAVPDEVIEAPFRGLVSAIFRKPFNHAKLLDTVAFCLKP